MKKFLPSFLIALVLLTGISKFVLADGANVNLTIKNNGDVVYSGTIPLSSISSEDNVLSVIKQADTLSPNFNISNITHYSFGDYLKCVTISEIELCDNWQYKVDGISPDVGMDSKILSGGENIVLYFGDENKAPEPIIETPPAHSGGGGHIILNPVPISSPLPVSPAPTPSSPNTNLEEKTQPVLSPTPKKQIKKINKITKQNTATAINAVPQIPPATQTGVPKESWWNRFWNNIFSIF